MIRPGGIMNSNSFSLASAVQEAGAKPVILGIARDSLPALREKLAAGLSEDTLITSAGVSVGDRDLVREALSGPGSGRSSGGAERARGVLSRSAFTGFRRRSPFRGTRCRP